MPFERSKSLFGIACAGVLSLTGCEFGNKNVTQLTGYDTISGYYASLPQTISFHARIGGGAERNQTGVVTQMPDFLKTVMGNPTMLYYDDPIQAYGSLRSHANTGVGFPTKINDRLATFGVSTSGYADVSGCRYLEETLHTGRFNQAATTSVIAGLTVRGNLALDYSATFSFVGDDVDCDAMRAIFKSCYSDNVNCSADPESIFSRAHVVKVFGSLVGSGIMTEAEISSARSVGYHATYE